MLYPSISSPPAFAGPLIIKNGTFEDQTGLTYFYFECRIHYRRVTADDGARFDVVLTFDGEIDDSTMKTTTSLERTVVFTPADLRGHFGTKVSRTIFTSVLSSATVLSHGLPAPDIGYQMAGPCEECRHSRHDRPAEHCRCNWQETSRTDSSVTSSDWTPPRLHIKH